MTSFVSHTTIDCANAYELSTWWKQVVFIEVPEPKSVKNRIHLDLRPSDCTQDEEVQRLKGLGATELSDHRGQYGPGTGWVVLADPEGNEFCILRSEAERREPTS